MNHKILAAVLVVIVSVVSAAMAQEARSRLRTSKRAKANLAN